MSTTVEHQIEAAEEQLRRAMLDSDLASLDALISPELIFTTHLGSVISKQEDLEFHRAGALKLQTLEPSEQRIIVLGEVAYVTVRMKLSGISGDSPFEEDLRFSRVWRLSADSSWQVVAGQVTAVQE